MCFLIFFFFLEICFGEYVFRSFFLQILNMHINKGPWWFLFEMFIRMFEVKYIYIEKNWCHGNCWYLNKVLSMRCLFVVHGKNIVL